jgi:hypothetical protein
MEDGKWKRENASDARRWEGAIVLILHFAFSVKASNRTW